MGTDGGLGQLASAPRLFITQRPNAVIVPILFFTQRFPEWSNQRFHCILQCGTLAERDQHIHRQPRPQIECAGLIYILREACHHANTEQL